MRMVELIAIAFAAITAAGLSVHVGSAQTPDLQCTQFSNVPDDGTPLAVGLKALASKETQRSLLTRRGGHRTFVAIPAKLGPGVAESRV